MGMRLGSAHGLGAHTWRALMSALAVTMLVTLGTTSASARSATCSVTNTDSGRSFPRLQQAVDAAKPGARLTVRGICHGKTVIDKRLLIVGVTTRRFGPPKLTRYAKPLVLEVLPRGRVKLWDLVVLLGDSFDYSYPGISNEGNLVLRDVVVRRNRPCSAGNHAVYNLFGGFLSMRGHSSVSRIRCDDPSVEEYNDLRIGGVFNDGTLVMHDASSIFDNRGRGLTNSGRVTMNDTSSIRANRALDDVSGGVWNDERAVFTMNDASTISDNSGSYSGGVSNLGTFSMNDDSSIRGNRATLGSSGGFTNWGTLTMNDASSMVGNTAVASPGGLHNGLFNASRGVLIGINCGPGGNIYGNTPDDCYLE